MWESTCCTGRKTRYWVTILGDIRDVTCNWTTSWTTPVGLFHRLLAENIQGCSKHLCSWKAGSLLVSYNAHFSQPSPEDWAGKVSWEKEIKVHELWWHIRTSPGLGPSSCLHKQLQNRPITQQSGFPSAQQDVTTLIMTTSVTLLPNPRLLSHSLSFHSQTIHHSALV